jgi:LmbE family N-acetylglucosaminyl deacetylase
MPRLICFTAHPDDETVFAGATLCRLAGAGAEIHLVCATRGEGGEAGEPPLCPHERLGAVREQELRCAARALGLASVRFLPFRDPDVGEDGSLHAYTAAPEEAAVAFAGCLSGRRWDALLTHGTNGEYGHPAHVLTHRAGLAAAQTAGMPLVLTFSADFPGHPRRRSVNRDDPADIVVDITSLLDAKLAAMECHRTQHALFVRRPSAEAGRPVSLRESLTLRESFRAIQRTPDSKAVLDSILAALGEWILPIQG